MMLHARWGSPVLGIAHSLGPADLLSCLALYAVTALVPASVRVRREQAPARPITKASPAASGEFGASGTAGLTSCCPVCCLCAASSC